METIKAFFSDASNLFQLTGGLIALVAAIFGIFYKDTVKKDTYKLTGWGWAALFFLLFGAAINSSSKFYDFKKERRESIKRDSTQHIQDSLRDLQLVKLIDLTKDLDTLSDTSYANFTKTSNSFKLNITKLGEINREVQDASNSLNPVSPADFTFSLVYDISSKCFSDLYSNLKKINNDLSSLSSDEIKNALESTPSNSYYLNSPVFNSFADLQIRFRSPDKNNKNEIYFTDLTLKKRYFKIKSIGLGIYFLYDSLQVEAKNPGQTKNKSSLLNYSKLHQLDLVIIKYFFPKTPKEAEPFLDNYLEAKFPGKEMLIIYKNETFKYDNTEKYLNRYDETPTGYDSSGYLHHKTFALKYWDYR